MKIKNLTSSQLADTIGVQRSGISHFFSGRNKPSLEFILKILAFFPDVNPDWLLFGRDSVFRSGSSESKLDSNYAIPMDAGIPFSEEINVFQPLFMDDLFGESAKTQAENVKEEAKAFKNKAESPKQSPRKDQDLKNNGLSGSETFSPEAFEKESPERIVIFYKNRIFREYLPG